MERAHTMPEAFGDGEFHRRQHQQAIPLEVRDHSREDEQLIQNDAIIRNIASFLTISDAASLMSRSPSQEAIHAVDSWAVGDGFDMEEHANTGNAESAWDRQIVAPQTPAYISVSPGATPHFEFPMQHHEGEDYDTMCMSSFDGMEEDLEDAEMDDILYERRRKWVQERLASAVYSHPSSIRSFCLDAYQSAKEIMRQRKGIPYGEDPETMIEPMVQFTQQKRRRRNTRRKLISAITELVLNNIPLSVLIDVLERTGELSLDTTFASFRVAGNALHGLVNGFIRLLGAVWHGVVNFNPFSLLEAIVSFQFNAMGKTTDILASGIQSVATGVGSASSLALHRLSAANLSVATRAASTNSVRHGDPSLMGPRSNGNVLNKKLLRKLSAMNDAARVVNYFESQDDTGGLTKHARSKVQRMMHYEVSLRPFVATVRPPNHKRDNTSSMEEASSAVANHEPGLDPLMANGQPVSPQLSAYSPTSYQSSHISDGSSTGSPDSVNMFTPQSFPATPQTRQLVMARGGRFADDVLFLARDRLRLHDSMESSNEKTREMAKALREGKRLAVFNARDASNGIELTCGQHIATKVGTVIYCTTRSCVPVLRNCLVYFEMTVLPRSFGDMGLQPSMTTLSIGLSTEEMPANALVGAWQGSCGLCTTGQIFAGGEWCAPSDPLIASYRDGATVGTLVYLDDASAVDTWEGLLVNATITFNVNGYLVSPILSSTIGATIPASTSLPTNPVGGKMPAGTPSRKPGQKAEGKGDSSASFRLPQEGEEADRKMPADVAPTEAHSSVHSRTSFSSGRTNSRQTLGTSTSALSLRAERPSTTLAIKVPASEELYPTVTLHSPATSVMCRFSAEDIVASSKETIGAPENATVFAVDGSVIFE